MPLIIDCYNLLHETMPPSLAGLDEARLCQLLAESPWANDRILVVCDGVPKPLGLTESPVDQVDLIYSGPNRTADDVIIDQVDKDTAPKRLLVVSTDRQIQKAARRRRAKSWSSAQFIRELAGSLTRSSKDRRHNFSRGSSSLSKKEVDQWLDEFDISDDDLEDFDDKTSIWPPKVD